MNPPGEFDDHVDDLPHVRARDGIQREGDLVARAVGKDPRGRVVAQHHQLLRVDDQDPVADGRR